MRLVEHRTGTADAEAPADNLHRYHLDVHHLDYVAERGADRDNCVLDTKAEIVGDARLRRVQVGIGEQVAGFGPVLTFGAPGAAAHQRAVAILTRP